MSRIIIGSNLRHEVRIYRGDVLPIDFHTTQATISWFFIKPRRSIRPMIFLIK